MIGSLLQQILSIFTVEPSQTPVEVTLASHDDDAASTCRGFCYTEQTFAIVSCVAAAGALVSAYLSNEKNGMWRFVRRMMVFLMVVSLVIVCSIVTNWRSRGVDKCGFDTDSVSGNVAGLSPTGFASSVAQMTSNSMLQNMTTILAGAPVEPVTTCYNTSVPADELSSCSIDATIEWEEYGASFYIIWIAFGFGLVAFATEILGIYSGNDYTALSNHFMNDAKF